MATNSAANEERRAPIPFDALERRSEEFRLQFHSAKPWSHVVIDDFLDPHMAERVLAGFPKFGRMKGGLALLLEARSYEGAICDEDLAIKEVFDALHSARFTSFLESITGISSLEPDVDNIGAGIHQGALGSYLRIHADHNTHPLDRNRFRRLNVLIYLNEAWKAEWNGDLELWDREALSCQSKIEPKFNRCAILVVDDTAYHGYGPLRLPSGKTRKALASYYYASAPSANQVLDPHPTTMPALAKESKMSALAHRVRRAILFRIERLLR